MLYIAVDIQLAHSIRLASSITKSMMTFQTGDGGGEEGSEEGEQSGAGLLPGEIPLQVQ